MGNLHNKQQCGEKSKLHDGKKSKITAKSASGVESSLPVEEDTATVPGANTSAEVRASAAEQACKMADVITALKNIKTTEDWNAVRESFFAVTEDELNAIFDALHDIPVSDIIRNAIIGATSMTPAHRAFIDNIDRLASDNRTNINHAIMDVLLEEIDLATLYRKIHLLHHMRDDEELVRSESITDGATGGLTEDEEFDKLDGARCLEGLEAMTVSQWNDIAQLPYDTNAAEVVRILSDSVVASVGITEEATSNELDDVESIATHPLHRELNIDCHNHLFHQLSIVDEEAM